MTDGTRGITGAHAWELWRQDDNGNRFRIARFATKADADAEQHRYEALAHKQIYWVEHHGDGDGG